MTAKKSKTKRPKSKSARRSKPTEKVSRFGPLLSKLVYSYMEPGNAFYARKQGKKKQWGSISAYVNALVAKDRGVKPVEGTRGQDGFKQKRRSKHNKPRLGEARRSKKSSSTKSKSPKKALKRPSRRLILVASNRIGKSTQTHNAVKMLAKAKRIHRSLAAGRKAA